MFIFISAFISKQICRCLFKCVYSDPCSVLHFSLLAFCKSLNVIGRGGSQNPSHNISTWELLCIHRASATLPLGKGLHPPDAISQDTSAQGAEEESMQQMGWTCLKRPEFQLLAHFSSLSFVFPAWCPVLKQSMFRGTPLVALGPCWGVEQEE